MGCHLARTAPWYNPTENTCIIHAWRKSCPKPIRLSQAARDLLRRRANRERVEVTPANLEAYRELARAGIMESFSGFMRGPEAVFRLTQQGWERREELRMPGDLLQLPAEA